MFKTTGKHVPPPPTMPSPLKWGDEETVRERLHDGVADLQMTRRMCSFKYTCSPAEMVELFRKYYGPTQRAFESLGCRRAGRFTNRSGTAVGRAQSSDQTALRMLRQSISR